MNKLIQKKGFNIWYSIVLNALIMIASLFIFDTFYEISDDYFLSQFVADGRYDFVFVSNILMRILCAIQSVIAPINAHVIVSLALAYISLCVISKIFLDKFETVVGTIFIIVMNALFLVNYYLTISFTRLPGLLATAGLLSIIHYTRQKKWIFGTIVGIILTFLSSLYRISVFELAFCMAIAFVAALSFSDFYDTENKKFSNLIKIIFEPKRLVSAVLVLVFSCNYVSNQLLNSDDNTKNYMEYTSVRSSITDYSIPSYDEAKSAYDELNIDENDLLLLKAGFMDEEGAFSLEKLNQIEQVKNNASKSIISITKSMLATEAYCVINFSTEGIEILAVAILFLLYYLIQRKKSIISPILVILATVLAYLYIWYMGRVVLRVNVTILISAFVYLAYLFDKNKLKKVNKKSTKVLLSAVLIIACLVGGYRTVNTNEHISYYPHFPKAEQISEYINENKDKKFEMARDTSFTCNMPDDSNSVFKINKSSYSNNYVQTFFTYYKSSYYYDKINGFGTTNFYSNLLNSDVYFVVYNDNDYGQPMKEYLQKYYSNGRTVQMETIKILDYYTVYNYTLV